MVTIKAYLVALSNFQKNSKTTKLEIDLFYDFVGEYYHITGDGKPSK